MTNLKVLLEAQPVDEPAVQVAMSFLAEQLSLLATDMGGEGEMPCLLEGLATVRRQVRQEPTRLKQFSSGNNTSNY